MKITQTTTIVSVTVFLLCYYNYVYQVSCISTTAGDAKNEVGITNLAKAEFPGKLKRNGCMSLNIVETATCTVYWV